MSEQFDRRMVPGRYGMRTPRDGYIVQRWQAGATLAAIARATGMTESGVWRALIRLDALERPAPDRQKRADALRPGPRPVWPDCPPHLRADYQKIRCVIGARAARDQLLKLDSRLRGNDQGEDAR